MSPEVEDDPGTHSEIVLLVADGAAIQELRVKILGLSDADGDSVSKSVIQAAAYRIEKAVVCADRS
jgi:hypothetical protein